MGGQNTIAVVGAGASGLVAARRAALALRERGEEGRVLLLDGNPKPGKKLLATGNGRCNLTNLNISPSRYHGDRLAARVLERYPARRILDEFFEMGLLCVPDDAGWVYPNSRQAAAVLQALWSSCREAGVEFLWEFPVSSAVRRGDGFLLRCEDGRELSARRCVLACGGKASPVHSHGRNGYELARALGHAVAPLSPSLVPLKTDSKSCKALRGMRCRARAALMRNDRAIYAESGEVLFGDGQLSGICVFNLSARLREAGTEDLTVSLDLLEGMNLAEAVSYLRRLRETRPALPAEELFSGALNLRVGRELAKLLGLAGDRPIASLSDGEMEKAARLAKDWRFPVTGAAGWESAQASAGGVPLSELDLDTMESKKCPGLYLAGEILDVDGDCGGYNLHWAWATGLTAGNGVR